MLEDLAGPATDVRHPTGQHTSRRRNAAARDSIVDSTFELLRTEGASGLGIDAIAEAAGVGSADASLGLLIDVAYGVLWYRALVGHAPLDAGAAPDLGTVLITAACRGGE
jgi:hypothetical protein